jgi:hypothetical protein
VASAAFSPDSVRVVTASADGAARAGRSDRLGPHRLSMLEWAGEWLGGESLQSRDTQGSVGRCTSGPNPFSGSLPRVTSSRRRPEFHIGPLRPEFHIGPLRGLPLEELDCASVP